ncbi:hypothetical protein [Hydrogenimonas sp.]
MITYENLTYPWLQNAHKRVHPLPSGAQGAMASIEGFLDAMWKKVTLFTQQHYKTPNIPISTR